jgi:hypothetical protein
MQVQRTLPSKSWYHLSNAILLSRIDFFCAHIFLHVNLAIYPGILVAIQFINASIGYYEITKAGDAVDALRASLQVACLLCLASLLFMAHSSVSCTF